MSQSLRKEVLKSFKLLHKTRRIVFKDDTYALEATRMKINEEFKKNKDVAEDESIEKLLKFSKDVETELRTRVVQAREKKPGVYELRMRPEVQTNDNVPYFGPTFGAEEIKNTGKCCQEKEQKEK